MVILDDKVAAIVDVRLEAVKVKSIMDVDR